jgi:hypothetical protein
MAKARGFLEDLTKSCIQKKITPFSSRSQPKNFFFRKLGKERRRKKEKKRQLWNLD